MKDKVKIVDKGEIYRDGELIDGSNVGDLIQHAVRDHRRKRNPFDWKEFVQYMKLHNAPKVILNYDTR